MNANALWQQMISLFSTPPVVSSVESGKVSLALLDHTFPALADGRPVPLRQFEGQVILVVNTASECGFTGQYDGLQRLYGGLKDAGFVVLGFPANDFGGQEPGSEPEIAAFCRLNYGVDFPMFAKTVVSGSEAHPFFRQLAEITGSAPKWNFHKYLINRDATRVAAFSTLTAPDAPKLRRKIDEFLRT